jgi:hypothetical protein
MPHKTPNPAPGPVARGEFIAQWRSIGTQWGVNRTMPQIHALLITSRPDVNPAELSPRPIP